MAVKGKEHFWGVCKAVLGCKTWKMVSVNAPLGISAGKCLTGTERPACGSGFCLKFWANGHEHCDLLVILP